MTNRMSLCRLGAALLLGASSMAVPIVAQPAAAQARPDPWAGTPGRAEEQAGLRIWNQAAPTMMMSPAERETAIASYFEENPDKAAERTALYAEAVRLSSAAARQGDARAMYLLAALYGNGWGVEKDDAKKLALYRQAAEAGDNTPMGDWTASGQAMLQLGWMSNMGEMVIGRPRGYNRNPEEAAKWFRRWAATVKPGTPSALKAEAILATVATPEFQAGFVPIDMPTLAGR